MKIKSFVLMASLVVLAGHAPASFSTGSDPAGSSAEAAPAAGSKFSKIHVGMYSKEVMDLIGPPTDQKSYQTGKAWIPFHFGGDNYRVEFLYKGEGSLTFSGGGIGSSAMKLIKVTPNPSESGYVH
ncbi:hypothetical protein ACPPVV_01725 [Rhodanobacter sp. Col0626]|uniref:hypothetical protein n=1 Tax=Rhodanobacter sp. Col0626 TaxID=3415679 RepID=UPI003CE996B5